MPKWAGAGLRRHRKWSHFSSGAGLRREKKKGCPHHKIPTLGAKKHAAPKARRKKITFCNPKNKVFGGEINMEEFLARAKPLYKNKPYRYKKIPRRNGIAPHRYKKNPGDTRNPLIFIRDNLLYRHRSVLGGYFSC